MILFYICQQVCRHSMIFGCTLDAGAAGIGPSRLDLVAGRAFEPVHRLTPMRFNQCPPNANAGIARSVAQEFPHSLSSSQLCGLTVLRSQQQPEQAALSKRWDRRRIRVAQPVFMNSVNGTIHAILLSVASTESR